MKTNLLEPLETVPYFTINGFKQVLNADETDTQRVREMLSRWVEKRYVIRLKKGVYMTQRFFDSYQHHPSFRPAVSAIILPQSYISLEYVLLVAGVMTAATYPVTSVTPKNTRVIENVLGTFTYRHIKMPLYTGYLQEYFFGIVFHKATTTKALFDYLYLHPLFRSLRTQKINLGEELRLNLELLPSTAKDEFKDYVDLSDSPKMRFIYENFWSS